MFHYKTERDYTLLSTLLYPMMHCGEVPGGMWEESSGWCSAANIRWTAAAYRKTTKVYISVAHGLPQSSLHYLLSPMCMVSYSLYYTVTASSVH